MLAAVKPLSDPWVRQGVLWAPPDPWVGPAFDLLQPDPWPLYLAHFNQFALHQWSVERVPMNPWSYMPFQPYVTIQAKEITTPYYRRRKPKPPACSQHRAALLLKV